MGGIKQIGLIYSLRTLLGKARARDLDASLLIFCRCPVACCVSLFFCFSLYFVLGKARAHDLDALLLISRRCRVVCCGSFFFSHSLFRRLVCFFVFFFISSVLKGRSARP